ncbi:Scr1 family TA system antitoxin-like transcriptional regulator [Nocardiopsis aegyptia]|uniref:DUF5753 domain-containing protein n=1 Tax=Nocardiopsis aegyptia TaxID=220378 RepID=A0A7Z0ES67_9ACTN|nr:Scr1 family TA system antitoxin-like transcriptional regulator [Nocardiopsis aegyptia]NYJ37164.1 hypothetical protein [Nocardiopsis aegyptia]
MPEAIRREQPEVLLRMLERGRTTIHLIPNGSLYLASVAPLQVYRLQDGSTVASSDHGDGNIVHQTPSATARMERKVRDALSKSLPVDHTIMLLREML